jgi:hypothetical protein
MDRKYLTWDEIKKDYPDMWVSIIEPKFSQEHTFLGGFIGAANQDKKIALKEIQKLREQKLTSNVIAFYYTGDIPYFVGLSRMEFSDAQVRVS